jgi:hypothetical protein
LGISISFIPMLLTTSFADVSALAALPAAAPVPGADIVPASSAAQGESAALPEAPHEQDSSVAVAVKVKQTREAEFIMGSSRSKGCDLTDRQTREHSRVKPTGHRFVRSEHPDAQSPAS